MKRSFKFGQSLIEVVIAVGIVAIAVVALVSAIIFTQKTARSANAQIQATKLAEASIEEIRVLRDRKGYAYLETTGTCKVIDSSLPEPSNWLLNNCVPPGETIVLENISFARMIVISEPNPGVKKMATVTVSWQESGGERSVKNSTFLSNCLGASC